MPQSDPGGAQPPLVNLAVRRGGNGIARLPRTREEARNILALAKPGEAVAFLDFNANKAAAEDPQLANYRVVHFATHGLIDTEHPQLSGLVLSQYNERGQPVDGFLRLNEIFNLQLPVELVVLSACESGQGKMVTGEGLVGLTRGFMYAGAPSLVVSLWSVDDAATSVLMTRFYKGLLGPEHLRPAGALRAAQLSMLKHPKWNQPYYWAAFAVEGEWR
jgi:CHAT domain-containing protein